MKFISLLSVLFFLTCIKPPAQKIKRIFYKIDTVVEVTLVLKEKKSFLKRVAFSFWKNSSNKKIDSTWNKIDSVLSEWEERFSQTHPNSEVLQINRRSSCSMPVSNILAEMINSGLNYGDTLNGMFDLTILPIKELWGFGEKNVKEIIPSPDIIAETLKNVDYKKVRVDTVIDSVYFDNPKTVIDVGGIAKGFLLREIGILLDKEMYENYLIVAGGDILSKGKSYRQMPWKIGIQHPRNSQKTIATFALDSGAVVTSGDYERYRVYDNKRYHHIFNPKTGCCCTKNQSVTIWGMDPIIVDILSTGLFCFSKDSILAFVDDRPLLECVIVDSLGEISLSKGWKKKITLK